jgi:hypothetical protein
MDQIKYQEPTAAEFRAVRYGIHRNVHRRSVERSNELADRDTAKWLAEKEAARAADALQVAA